METMQDEELLPHVSFGLREVHVKEKDEKALHRIQHAEDQLIDETRSNVNQYAEQP
jgi:hypothetical protein